MKSINIWVKAIYFQVEDSKKGFDSVLRSFLQGVLLIFFSSLQVIFYGILIKLVSKVDGKFLDKKVKAFDFNLVDPNRENWFDDLELLCNL